MLGGWGRWSSLFVEQAIVNVARIGIKMHLLVEDFIRMEFMGLQVGRYSEEITK
jgi:hypothetical protein